jgi:hypothetical protein
MLDKLPNHRLPILVHTGVDDAFTFALQILCLDISHIVTVSPKSGAQA